MGMKALLRGLIVVLIIVLLPPLIGLLITIAAGVIRVIASGGHPTPVYAPPIPPPMTTALTYWLLLKVFASGCTALTGVEAVSNGVKAFREPTVKNAQRTLTVIIFLLAVLLAGISFLVKVYGIAATDPGTPGYQSVLSMLTAAVFGKGAFYYLTIGAILVVPAAALTKIVVSEFYLRPRGRAPAYCETAAKQLVSGKTDVGET